ncbi:MAG: polysaccharide biosynthesis protein [Lachnospiraceae bacterium]|nr:polysaccharide biosynthesis protein [Lachnospiraceae bacterium]
MAFKKNNQNNKRRALLEHWQIIGIAIALFDALAVFASYFGVLWLRFDAQYSRIDVPYLQAFYQFIPFYIVGVVIIFYFFHLYNAVWKYASYTEAVWCILANLITSTLHAVFITLFFHRMPLSYYLGGAMLQMVLVTGIRFIYRIYVMMRDHFVAAPPVSSKDTSAKGNEIRGNVMIVGAGGAGRSLNRELDLSKHSAATVKCFIDDDPNQWGRYIDGIKIVGGREDILNAVQEYKIDHIYVAIPSATNEQRRDILNICNETGVDVKVLPSIIQLANGEATLAQLKDVAVEDLLGRDVIKVNNQEIFDRIAGKVILVTGGGGSIGSELCRQIAAHSPSVLIIFDVYENNAYDIQLELKRKYPNLNLVTLIGSVRDSRRLESVFSKYRPQIVFHAAAHKHVPLMEDSPCEAVKNNVIGTYKTAFMALRYGVDRFVLISTDKAVNPTNVMGASKRICEMVIQTINEYMKEGRSSEIPKLFTHDRTDTEENVFVPAEGVTPHTEFVAVRFGNVLGSNGSVIPLFKRQIEEGGPVTVTHPDIIRYFMTIPEAVSLVLQASVYAHGGEIFVLDMGEPVKIDTLARNLIRLSGHKPDEDIQIVYTGLRPGEKLYEEKLMNEEGLTKTANELIFIGKPVEFDHQHFLHEVQELMDQAYANDENIRANVMAIVREGGAKEVKQEVGEIG